MKLLLILALTSSQLVHAQDGGIYDVAPGESLQMFGPARCLDEPAWVNLGQRLKEAQTERDLLSEAVDKRPGWPAVLLGTTAGLVVGAVVTAVIFGAVKK